MQQAAHTERAREAESGSVNITEAYDVSGKALQKFPSELRAEQIVGAAGTAVMEIKCSQRHCCENSGGTAECFVPYYGRGIF